MDALQRSGGYRVTSSANVTAALGTLASRNARVATPEDFPAAFARIEAATPARIVRRRHCHRCCLDRPSRATRAWRQRAPYGRRRCTAWRHRRRVAHTELGPRGGAPDAATTSSCDGPPLWPTNILILIFKKVTYLVGKYALSSASRDIFLNIKKKDHLLRGATTS